MEGEREARLDRDEFTRLLRLVDAAEELEHGYEPEEYDTYVERLLAHDAALRAEIDRLRARQREGDGSCRICNRPTDGVTLCRYCDRMMEAATPNTEESDGR